MVVLTSAWFNLQHRPFPPAVHLPLSVLLGNLMVLNQNKRPILKITLATTPFGAVPASMIFKKEQYCISPCGFEFVLFSRETVCRRIAALQAIYPTSLPVYPRNSVVGPLSVLTKGTGTTLNRVTRSLGSLSFSLF
jgi:hypothetical protein